MKVLVDDDTQLKKEKAQQFVKQIAQHEYEMREQANQKKRLEEAREKQKEKELEDKL